jgi:hypothetical protein
MVELSEKLSRPDLGPLTGFLSASSRSSRDTRPAALLENLAGSFMAGKELCQARPEQCAESRSAGVYKERGFTA